MGWYAIRSLFLFARKPNGKNIFEERIVCFQAKTPTEAQQKGLEEAKAYAIENNFILYEEQVGYLQDGDNLIDGYEVWAILYESNLSFDDFYKEKYERWKYHPGESNIS